MGLATVIVIIFIFYFISVLNEKIIKFKEKRKDQKMVKEYVRAVAQFVETRESDQKDSIISKRDTYLRDSKNSGIELSQIESWESGRGFK